jgi:hypothetical protein
MTNNDMIKLKHLEQFQKRFIELKNEFPDVGVYGDVEGCVHCCVDLDEPDYLSCHDNEFLMWGVYDVAQPRPRLGNSIQ